MENISRYIDYNKMTASPNLMRPNVSTFNARSIQADSNETATIASDNPSQNTSVSTTLESIKNRFIKIAVTIGIIVVMPITVVITTLIFTTISSIFFPHFLYSSLQKDNAPIAPTILSIIAVTPLSISSGIISGAFTGIVLSCFIIYLITQEILLRFATEAYDLVTNTVSEK